MAVAPSLMIKAGGQINSLEPVQYLDQGMQCKAKLNEKAEHT